MSQPWYRPRSLPLVSVSVVYVHNVHTCSMVTSITVKQLKYKCWLAVWMCNWAANVALHTHAHLHPECRPQAQAPLPSNVYPSHTQPSMHSVLAPRDIFSLFFWICTIWPDFFSCPTSPYPLSHLMLYAIGQLSWIPIHAMLARSFSSKERGKICTMHTYASLKLHTSCT